jgi:hypothetical protein
MDMALKEGVSIKRTETAESFRDVDDDLLKDVDEFDYES